VLRGMRRYPCDSHARAEHDHDTPGRSCIVSLQTEWSVVADCLAHMVAHPAHLDAEQVCRVRDETRKRVEYSNGMAKDSRSHGCAAVILISTADARTGMAVHFRESHVTQATWEADFPSTEDPGHACQTPSGAHDGRGSPESGTRPGAVALGVPVCEFVPFF